MPATPAPNRIYAAAHFALELDGSGDVGLCRSIEGGGVKADVMTYQYGQHYDKWRLLGKQKYEDIKLQIGMSMSKPFYDWIEAFFEGKAERKNGAIVAADFHYNERARRVFYDAMIKELTFPKLDGSDKNAANLTVAVAVEKIEFKAGTANTKLTESANSQRQKMWTACNFRLELDGLGGLKEACRRVTKIDSFTIKQNILEYHAGGRQSPIKCPSQIEFPVISFYVPEADAGPFFDHFTKRALNEKREQRGHDLDKKTGMIEVYDNAQNALFSLEFFEADICNVQPDKSDSTTEEIKQVKIDLSIERLKFKYADPGK